MLKLLGINKYYRSPKQSFQALRQVSLRIDEGDFISIMGASGSGKSTLINILGLLDKDFEGTYQFLEQDISSLDDEALATFRGQKIGFVFQHFNLLEAYTVLENILMPFLYRQDKPDRIYIDSLLETFGLADKISAYPSDLSGGQKQRVAIIRALATKPSFLIADEPTGALDSKTRDDILEVLSSLNQKGMTICLVTHDKEVAAIADRHLILSDGYLQEEEF